MIAKFFPDSELTTYLPIHFNPISCDRDNGKIIYDTHKTQFAHMEFSPVLHHTLCDSYEIPCVTLCNLCISRLLSAPLLLLLLQLSDSHLSKPPSWGSFLNTISNNFLLFSLDISGIGMLSTHCNCFLAICCSHPSLSYSAISFLVSNGFTSLC